MTMTALAVGRDETHDQGEEHDDDDRNSKVTKDEQL